MSKRVKIKRNQDRETKTLKTFTLEEFRSHKEGVWITIDGFVYDVTTFLKKHPGGDDILEELNGKDATDDFQDASHSGQAEDLREEYLIGRLSEEDFKQMEREKWCFLNDKPIEVESWDWNGLAFILIFLLSLYLSYDFGVKQLL